MEHINYENNKKIDETIIEELINFVNNIYENQDKDKKDIQNEYYDKFIIIIKIIDYLKLYDLYNTQNNIIYFNSTFKKINIINLTKNSENIILQNLFKIFKIFYEKYLPYGGLTFYIENIDKNKVKNFSENQNINFLTYLIFPNFINISNKNLKQLNNFISGIHNKYLNTNININQIIVIHFLIMLYFFKINKVMSNNNFMKIIEKPENFPWNDFYNLFNNEYNMKMIYILSTYFILKM